MTDPTGSRPIGVPLGRREKVPDKGSRRRERSDDFLRKLFATGFHYEESFRKLCDAGCPAEQFAQLLWAACVLIPIGSGPLVNSGDISKAQLKGLPKKLRALAEIVKRLNTTVLAPANEARIAAPNSQGQLARDYLVKRYEMLPGMMCAYSYHVERFSKIARMMLKRLTSGHLVALQLLQFVEDCTGKPQYQEIAGLLIQGCVIVQTKDRIPDFITEDGLAKLYQRWRGAIRATKSL